MIKLSSLEQKIFQFFIEINTHYNLNQTIRVTGGWVRDKLIHH